MLKFLVSIPFYILAGRHVGLTIIVVLVVASVTVSVSEVGEVEETV